MQKAINIQEGDLLWFFYRKWFSIKGMEVELPKNLCQYFWTAVYGFGLWLGYEVELKIFWALALAAIGLFFLSALLEPAEAGLISKLVIAAVGVIMGMAFLVAILVSLNRFRDYVEKKAKWPIYLFGGGMVAYLLVDSATHGILLPAFHESIGLMLQMIKYGAILMFILFIVTLLLCKIPHRHLQKMREAFDVFCVYLEARKRRVCPLVNPPPGLEKKEEMTNMS